jgi:hypothetical protein
MDSYYAMKSSGNYPLEEMADISMQGILYQIREEFINEMKKREHLFEINEVGEAIYQLFS